MEPALAGNEVLRGQTASERNAMNILSALIAGPHSNCLYPYFGPDIDMEYF